MGEKATERKLVGECQHFQPVYDTPRSVFAPYCECCLAWLGTRASKRCAACEVKDQETSKENSRRAF